MERHAERSLGQRAQAFQPRKPCRRMQQDHGPLLQLGGLRRCSRPDGRGPWGYRRTQSVPCSEASGGDGAASWHRTRGSLFCTRNSPAQRFWHQWRCRTWSWHTATGRAVLFQGLRRHNIKQTAARSHPPCWMGAEALTPLTIPSAQSSEYLPRWALLCPAQRSGSAWPFTAIDPGRRSCLAHPQDPGWLPELLA